jgi:hypothetical protein
MCSGKKSSPPPAPAPVAPAAPTGSTAGDSSNAAQRQQAIASTMLSGGQAGAFGSELGGSSGMMPATPGAA